MSQSVPEQLSHAKALLEEAQHTLELVCALHERPLLRMAAKQAEQAAYSVALILMPPVRAP